jgi:crotonobetainyl-CoA:carnitine CoA-transferase CaiB-like acyl-CoA transferase
MPAAHASYTAQSCAFHGQWRMAAGGPQPTRFSGKTGEQQIMNPQEQKQALPLQGVRVVELTHIVAGPSGGVLLADLGADIIKIEHPDLGDTARSSGNQGAGFYTFNRNKRFLALDLKKPGGRRIFEQLVKQADIVLDNFAPGALDRAGLNYEWGRKINPRIIYCSVKGFLSGPSSDRPSLDELAQMEGGLAYLTGFKDRPMRAGASITDIGAAAYGVIGILAALHRRNTTGVGEHIESGLFETIAYWISQHVTNVQMTGKNPQPRGREDSGMGRTMGWGVYQLFPTIDGRQIFIAVTGNRHWEGLCKALGFDDWKDDERFNSNKKRTANKPEIALRIKDAVEKLQYEDISQRLYKNLVPYAPVNSPVDLVDDAHLNQRGHYLQVSPQGTPYKVLKPPFSMENTVDFSVRHQPATLGAHTDDILTELGYTAAQIAALKAEGVVDKTDAMLNPGERPGGSQYGSKAEKGGE